MTIRADGVGKAYGTLPVLDGFELHLEAGSVCALLGPNGAGLTVAARVVAHWRRQPAQLLLGLAFPVLMALMFATCSAERWPCPAVATTGSSSSRARWR